LSTQVSLCQQEFQQLLLRNCWFRPAASSNHLLAGGFISTGRQAKRLPELTTQRNVVDAQAIHGHVKVLTFQEATFDSTNVGEHFFDRVSFVRGPVKTTVA